MNTFTETQIENLRRSYSGISAIDPASPSYRGMIDLLNVLSRAQLKQLAGADIKFLSALARNRLSRELTKD